MLYLCIWCKIIRLTEYKFQIRAKRAPAAVNVGSHAPFYSRRQGVCPYFKQYALSTGELYIFKNTLAKFQVLI